MRLILKGWLIATLFFMAHVSIAADPASTARLKLAIAKGEWAVAESEIARLRQSEGVDEIDLHFLAGMMWMKRHEYAKAADEFRAALDVRPDLVRIRLELALALYRLGDDDAAKHHFKMILGAPVPPAVARNVRHYLTLIRQRRVWDFDASLGVLVDSNVNGGSEVDFIDIGGLRFRVNPDAREISSHGVSIFAEGRYRVPVSAMQRVNFVGSLARKDYVDSRFDDMIVRIAAGPSWLSEGGERSLFATVARRDYGNDCYNRGYGLRGEFNQIVTNRLLADLAAEWMKQSSCSFEGRDGDLGWISMQGAYLIDSVSSVNVGARYQTEALDSEYLSYTFASLNVGYRRDWIHGINFGIMLRQARIQYEGVQPIFNEERLDIERTLALNLSKRDLHFNGFVPAISVMLTERDSSIDFYSSKRTLWQFGGSRRF